ncbi:MAG: hypothetical protein GXP63_02545 [DPANN group archaeon]|nr:hypothetical protein [DPANN group archaeon]
MAQEPDDDDVVIDFSKITGLFTKKKTEKTRKTGQKKEKKTSPPAKGPEKEKKEEKKAQVEKKEDEPTDTAADPQEQPAAEQEKKEEEEETTSKDAHAQQTDEEPSEKKEAAASTSQPLKKAQQKEGQEEDDEITIDFSRITALFGKKRAVAEEHAKKHGKHVHTEEKETAKEEEMDDDDEASIDFSKIFAFFRSGKGKKAKTEEKATDEDEDIQIDWKKAAALGKKYAVLLLILIPLIMSVTFRVQPAILPATDVWATSTVNNYFRGQIAKQVNQQYPNLPQANKDKIIGEQFADFLSKQGSQVDQQVRGISEQFKQQLQDASGQTYLLAIDPYFWERLARNVVKNGNPGDYMKDGKEWDSHMMAPKGRAMPADMLHAYVEAYAYKIVRIFNRDIPLKNVAFYIPVLLATLAVIPAFFLGRRLGGNVGGLFAGILIAVHSQFMTRTAAGFADTDAYSVVLPLFIVWAFVEAFETDRFWKKTSLAAVAGFLVGVFAFSWTGAWYIFDIILATMAIYIVYLFAEQYLDTRELRLWTFFRSPQVKNTLYLFLIFFVVSAVFVILFRDTSTFTGSFIKGPLGFSEMKDVAINTIWPNVYTTVAEQNSSSLQGVINAMGGKMLFFLAIIGALMTIIRKDRKGKRDIKMAAILIIWMAVSTYAAIRGVRFSLLIVPAFSVGFGLFIGITYQYVSRWISKELHISKVISGTLLIILLSLFLIGPVKAGWDVASHEVPSMNDGWFTALDKIRQESPKNAIVNSWWDFGHWFKNIADRAVTFDGTSQNTPQAHWIGKVLLTDNEDEAVGILRMLDCSANDAFVELNSIEKTPLDAIRVLYDILPVKGRDKAKTILLDDGLSSAEAERVLDLTHCDPPQDYFIASEDMVGKSGVWAHFGAWNFTRSSMYKEVKGDNPGEGISTLKDTFKLSDQEAQSIYYDVQTADPNQWIAPWPSYASGLNSCGNAGEKLLRCANGIMVNLSKEPWEAYIESRGQRVYPRVLAYPTVEGMEQVKHVGDDVLRTNDGRELGLTLVPNGKGYQMLILSPKLAASMFTRLFYLQAHGLKYFHLFTQQRTISGGNIFVYNVTWQGGEMNLKDELKPKTEVKEGDTVSINYIGWDEQGTVFDTTIRDTDKSELTKEDTFDEHKSLRPFNFTVGSGQVIVGMDQQIRGMKLGEEKIMTIPPEQAYGTDPSKHPLGNKTLFFKVRLEEIS